MKTILIILLSFSSTLATAQFDKNPEYSIRVQNFENSVSIAVPHGWKLNYNTIDTFALFTIINQEFFKWKSIKQKHLFWIKEDITYSLDYHQNNDESFHLSLIDSSEIHKIKDCIYFNAERIDTLINDDNYLNLKFNCGECKETYFVSFFNVNNKLYFSYMNSYWTDEAYYKKYYNQIFKSLEFEVR